LQEAAIVLALLTDEDRVHRGLHVVVDAARAGAAEERERPLVCIEHYLLGLARVGTNEHHPAVAQTRMAYVLLCGLRRIGLAHTQFAEATCGTIRLKLLKLGVLVRVGVRRIKIAMASACPWQDEFELAHARLRNAIA